MEKNENPFNRLVCEDSPVSNNQSYTCRKCTLESNESSYSQYYKNTSKTIESSTQQRRETFLNEHKEKHNAIFDGHRNLLELFEECETSSMDHEPGEEEHGESMEVQNVDTGKLQRKRKIKFRMSFSEWFTDIPEDLAENWLVKFCPEGKRRLIVANKRITKSFNKFGLHTFQFPSNLPGGGRYNRHSSQKAGLTVLDCVFHEQSRTFFILDMLVWNSVPFLDCEAELRHCWIRSKYLECPDVFEAYGMNSYTFKVLLDYPADNETIESEIFRYNSTCDVMCEGLLFYHKKVPYITDSTPMVTWLRPFMLPEKLHISIPPDYETKKPENYIDMQSYLERITDNQKKRSKSVKKKAHRESGKMETETIT